MKQTAPGEMLVVQMLADDLAKERETCRQLRAQLEERRTRVANLNKILELVVRAHPGGIRIHDEDIANYIEGEGEVMTKELTAEQGILVYWRKKK